MSDGMRDRLIVALDVDTRDAAADLIERLREHVGWFKIGSHLFTKEGPPVCAMVKDAGAKLFLDMKFHDIPNTVYGAVTSSLALDVDMLTVHAGGGEVMIRSAREAVDQSGKQTMIVAVTVLTHFAPEDLGRMFGSDATSDELVPSLAALAKRSGAHGVVASARELRLIKDAVGDEFPVVTPGIRLPDQSGTDDQVRVVTPEQAITDGADYIVVGRPIIAANDPAGAAQTILTRMAGG